MRQSTGILTSLPLTLRGSLHSALHAGTGSLGLLDKSSIVATISMHGKSHHNANSAASCQHLPICNHAPFAAILQGFCLHTGLLLRKVLMHYLYLPMWLAAPGMVRLLSNRCRYSCIRDTQSIPLQQGLTQSLVCVTTQVVRHQLYLSCSCK